MKISMWVVLLMLGSSSADKFPCKDGQYLDGLVHICTDCAVACHVLDSQDCQDLCPNWPPSSTESTPTVKVRTNTLLSVVVAGVSILAAVVILVTGVVCVRRRRLIATRGQENGEDDSLRDHEDVENVVLPVEERDDNLEPAQEVGQPVAV